MADKQNVGGIEVTADVNLGPLNEKLDQLKDILATFDKRKFTVTGDLKGSFFKDLDAAIQKIAAGAKAPVQLDAAQNAAAKLQDQLNKMNNLEAKVASFEVANDAAASIQAFLDSQKFVAKISKFEIDENSLAEQIQTALTGRKFKLDVDIGEVTGTVTPGKGATAAQRAATPASAAPAKPAAAAAAATAAQAAGIDPAKIADAIAKAIAAATSGTAPAARSAAAKASAARGPETTVSEAVSGAFGLRRDVSSSAEWAARTNSPIPAIRQQLEGGGRIQYRGIGQQRYDLPRSQPAEPRGFRFSKGMAAARPDIAMVLADAGVLPGEYAPKEAAFQVGSILLQEQENEARDAVLKSIYRSAANPYDVGGGAAGLKRMGDQGVRRGFHGRRPTPRGTGRTPQFGGGRARLNAGTLTEPSVIGPALRTAMPTPRTAWHTGEGVQFDREFIDRVEGLIGGQGTATGRADTPAIAQARARAAALEKQEARTTPEEETLAKLRSTLSSFDTSQTLGVTGVNREANWQKAREELRPRMAKLREDVVSAGHKPREFFAGVRRSMEGRIQEGGKIEDIGSETGPLELEAITLTQLYKDLEIAQERRTGGRISKRGGRYGVRGAPMGKFETGIVTPGWIPRALTEAAEATERFQAGPKATSGRAVARKEKSTRRKALRGLGATVAEKGVDKRPETGLISARGKLFQRLFEGEAYKRIEELRNLESMTATGAVETYSQLSGQEQVDPAIEDMLRNEARKQFIAALPEDEADLYTKAQGIPMTDEEAQNWRANEVGRSARVGAEATAFDERHGRKRRTRATPAAAPTPEGTVTDLNEYRAFRKKGGGIGWQGPRGFVSQKNVPAERVAEEIQRIGGAASGIGGGGGTALTRGGGGGGIVKVHVVNFADLGRLLSGTTNMGGLKKGIADSFDHIIQQATAAGVDPIEALKALGIPAAEAKAAAGVPEVAGKRAKRVAAPRGARAAARFEDAAFTFAQGAEPSEEIVNPPKPGYDYAFWPESPMYQPSASFNQREEARTVNPAEAKRVEASKQAEVTRVRKEQDAADKAQEKAVDRLINAGVSGMPKTSKSMKLATPEEEKPAAAGTAAKPTKAKGIDNPADDFYKAAAKAGYPIAPRTGAADRRAMAQQEISQQYGEFNLQRQMLPERAPGVAFAQVFARLTGVKGRMEAAADARSSAERELLTAKELRMADEGRLVSVKEYRAALGENLGAQAASMQSQGKSNQEIKAALSEQSALHKRSISEEKELVAQVAKRRDTESEATQKLKETDTALSKAGGKMASFSQIGALFVGAKAFMLFNQALDQTIQLATDVGGRAVDQMLGFQATNDKVTKSLASQITAFHGNTLAAEGQMAVMAGLSDAGAKFIGKYVIPNAQAMAGSAANVQASDMFRAASYRGGQGGKYMGFAPGLFEGQGGVLGGQLLAEQMGGVPGVLERTVNDLSAFTSDMKTIPQLERSIAEDRANLIQVGPRSAAPSQAAYDAAVAAASAANAPMEGKIAFEEQRLAAAQGAPGTRTAYIKDLNDTMRRGAVRMGDLAGSTAQLETQFKEFGTEMKDVPTDVQDAMKTAGEKLGGAAPGLLQKMIESGVGIEGLEGKSSAEQASLVGKAVQQFATGRTTVDQQQYMNIQKQQLDAQIAGIEMQRVFQTQFVMPAQVSLERLMNPPTPIAAGTAEMAAVIPTGGPQPAANVPNFTAQIAAIQKLQDANQAYAQKSKVLEVINPDDRRNAEGLLDSLISMGAEMQKISTASAKMSGELAAAQYGNQRRIMVRELEDALALSGQVNNAGVGYLGVLQRQQVMLDRSNQSLSLQAQQIGIMLSQRQINFQRAVAGFVTPGITAEERGAAIEQAGIEADYAQKQLDIQKELAKNAQKSYKLNIQIFDETVKRQITDLRAGLGLLDKNYITNIEIKLNEDKLKEIDKARQVVAAKLNGYISAGIERQNLMISTAVTAAATISGSVADFYKTVTTMTNSYFTSVALWMQTVANGGTPPGTTKGGGGGANKSNEIPNAAGSLGTYSSPTSMLVGEAGTETVAILRNPRTASATPMGGGGGMTVVINVSGNSIRDDRDIDLLTDRIERKLNMKASLLGFRRPV